MWIVITRKMGVKRRQMADGRGIFLLTYPFPYGTSLALQGEQGLVEVQASSKQRTFCLLPSNFCLRLTWREAGDVEFAS